MSMAQDLEYLKSFARILKNEPLIEKLAAASNLNEAAEIVYTQV